METFCSIIALELILGFVIIPLYLFVRIYYYFMPSFINAYVTDRFEVINELNKTRFLVLSILLFCSFFFGISSTKIILSFDNSQFSFLTAFKIEFLTIVLLIVQFLICFSIESKIPNNFFLIIKKNFIILKSVFIIKDSVLDNNQTKVLNEINFESENNINFFLIKNSLLLCSFNVKIIEHSKEEIDKICNENIDLFENVNHMHSFINLISNQFLKKEGKFITEKIYLKAKKNKGANDKKSINEFLRKFIEFEKLKAGRKSQNLQIDFLNKFFVLNGNNINPFNHKDSKYFLK